MLVLRYLLAMEALTVMPGSVRAALAAAVAMTQL